MRKDVTVMRKIATKIGLLFFILISITELGLFLLLHQKIVHTRFEEELSVLMTKGNNHRDVLETYYNDETIDHIALMESQSDTNVILIDEQSDVLMASMPLTDSLREFISQQRTVPRDGLVLEDQWQQEPYIITMTPFQTDQAQGFLFMIQETDRMRNFVAQLNRHFLVGGIVLSIVTALVILIVSKIITKPVIRMKEATKALSEGHFSIQLERSSEDELGELAVSIQSLATELSHLKTERNEFLASISHELRTPLTYIKGYADVARNPAIHEKDRGHYLTIIIEETDKLTTMVTNLIELAQLESHHFTVKKESIHLCETLEEIVEKVQPTYVQARQFIQVNCPKNFIIAADPIRFEQLLMNLLQNAVRYSEAHAITTVEVVAQATEIQLLIKDEGKGIPQDVLPHLFERFYRADKSRSRALGGTGLGLAIVKEIADAHHWAIQIDSCENRGTTVIIKIPKE